MTKVQRIMIEFADQTGISTTKVPPRRYLWTDAYAVCNFLSLYRLTGEEKYRTLALDLIDQVHYILGRHREDDSRRGWISGLSDKEGQKHPTAGGLRIGKKLNERGSEEAYDEYSEWDQDGQYFHYLTKWMHALYRAGVVTGNSQYCRWAVELAIAAHAGFSIATPQGGKKRLLWKMSIDLSYPLVTSSGLHDSLDGYITYNELRSCVRSESSDQSISGLDEEIAETSEMIENQRWHTNDPLGMGGLLFDACRVLQLSAASYLTNPGMLAVLMRASRESLDAFSGKLLLSHPAEYRLAFRELGLSIGLRGVAKMRAIVKRKPGLFDDSLKQDIEELREHVPLGEAIENFWSKAANQQVSSWQDHLDINRVMLATSLLPDALLSLDLNEQDH